MKHAIHHICTTLEDMHRLMEELVALQRDNRQCCRAVTRVDTAPSPETELDNLSKEHYQEEELMTVKEAMAHLRASRWKIDDMRRHGILQTLCFRRRVRLIRTEVEAARQWSVNKGRI